MKRLIADIHMHTLVSGHAYGTIREMAAAAKEEGEVQATYYHTEVVPAMDALRAPVDKLEMIVDKEAWPMPSYGDLIFEV